jgi:ABC-type polysaccharide/polyol phosphate transport system ATPase subunit/ABC-type polysaccharide/polyol phosphate export permease
MTRWIVRIGLTISSRLIATRAPTTTRERELAAPGAGARTALALEGVSKTFRRPHQRRTTLKERASQRFRSQPTEVLQALDDVGFEVHPGEFFGIAGRNGSGKSTLLRCIAGIYDIDAGNIEVQGRLSPFVEFGVGFNREMTGRENALLSMVMLGLTPAQARARLNQVIDFAELEQFVDVRLKDYSSGMKVRLGFSVAIQVDADILLIDEVLAVGDASFQSKCFEEFERMKRAGHTVLLVTHDMEAMERFCHRALLLDRGEVAQVGTPDEIAEGYEALNREKDRELGRVKPRRRTAPGAARARRYAPSAFGGELRRFVTLTLTLARADFARHNEGSVFGYLVSVVRPVLLFAVTYVVFNRVAKFGQGVRDYPVYLLTAIMLWTYFTEATAGGLASLAKAQSLLRKLRFPRLVLPLSAVLKALANLGVNLIPVAVLAAAMGVHPRLDWLELPLLVAALVVLATGLAMLLSVIYVRYRDLGAVWGVVLQLLFFGSAVLYVITRFPEEAQRWMVLNPLAMVFTQMRHALIDPQAPTAADVVGGPAYLLITLAVIGAAFALGLWAFRRESPRAAERL